MTPEQSDALTARLKGMIPTMTDEQIWFWAERLKGYGYDVGVAAVDRYIRQESELKTPALTALLESERARRGAADYAKLQERLAERSILEYWQEVERFIANLSDDELSVLKAEALKGLAPAAVALVAKSDPRKSKVLKGTIFEIAKGRAAAA